MGTTFARSFIFFSTMNFEAALGALGVSPKAYLLLEPALQQHPNIQDVVLEERPDLALEVVGLDDKRLEALLVRAIRKGLTLEKVVSKRPEFASNLACILAALSRDPLEMRFAQLRVAASKLDDQNKLRLRNKVQESVSKNGKTLQFAEQFRGDTMIVLAACAQDARHAALAMDPLGSWLCSIEAAKPGSLAEIANILVNNHAPKKRTHFGSPKLPGNAITIRTYVQSGPTQDQQVEVPHKETKSLTLDVVKPSQDDKPSQDAAQPSQDSTKPSQDAAQPSQDSTKPSQDSTKPSQDAAQPSQDSTKPSQDSTKPSQDDKPSRDDKPSKDAYKPSKDASKPSQDAAQPSQAATKPSRDDKQSKGVVENTMRACCACLLNKATQEVRDTNNSSLALNLGLLTKDQVVKQSQTSMMVVRAQQIKASLTKKANESKRQTSQ